MRRSIKTLLVALYFALGLETPAVAGQFEDGTAAEARGDYATAHRLLRPLADQGDARAQLDIGFMYYRGQGVPQDYAEGLRWFAKAADQGNAGAQFNLGVAYERGQSVPQDYEEAVKWYRKAVDQDLTPALCNLGLMYTYGKGIPQDLAAGAKLCRKAARRGNPNAMNNLGTMYEHGFGVPHDHVRAHMWYDLADWRFPKSVREDRDKAVANRARVANEMTPTQIAEAQQLAREWKLGWTLAPVLRLVRFWWSG
jgi:hypothetical protein